MESAIKIAYLSNFKNHNDEICSFIPYCPYVVDVILSLLLGLKRLLFRPELSIVSSSQEVVYFH